jgi:hypothetical protein
VAAALTAAPLDPWHLLVLGLGLAAAVCTPSLVAGERLAGLTGSSVGALTFVALVGLPALAPAAGAWLDVLARYPALLAMPLAWASARVVAR